MSDKTTKQTKAELLEMLAEAVRNTQPQPSGVTDPKPINDPEPKRKARKARSVPNRAAKAKKAPRSAKRKERRR